jgi:DNA-binding transcriptional regulator of glucitol operon
VQSEQSDSGQVSGSRNCTRYCVRNVVELQVEEDIKTKARELLNGARAFGGEKLAPDFENPRDASELAGQINCRSKMFKIQSDDKSPVGGGG